MAGWNTELGLVPAVGQRPRCESPRPCQSGGHQGPSPMLGLSPIVGICCLFQVLRWGVVPAEQTKKLSASAGVEPQRPGCCTPDHATAADANALCCGGTVCYLGVFLLVSNTPRWGFRPSRNNPRSSVPARWGGVALCPLLLLPTCWVMVRLAAANTAPHLDTRCAPCIPARDKGHSVRVGGSSTTTVLSWCCHAHAEVARCHDHLLVLLLRLWLAHELVPLAHGALSVPHEQGAQLRTTQHREHPVPCDGVGG